METEKKAVAKKGWVRTMLAVYWTAFVFLGFFTLIGVGTRLDDTDAANPNAVSDTTSNITGATQNAGGGVGFDVYVCNILLPAAGYLVGALTVLMIVLAGVMYATSQGSGSGDLSIGSAKQMIMAALTGALLYMMGYFLLGDCGIGGNGGGSETRGVIQYFLNK